MIWIIGSGAMAEEYARVIKAWDREFVVIGRGEAGVKRFEQSCGFKAHAGGLQAFLAGQPMGADHAIVAVDVEQLHSVTKQLIGFGIKNILVEKPGGISDDEVIELAHLATAAEAKVLIGYNRRFYASVQALRERISSEGGVRSLHFEFTEWSHRIVLGDRPKKVLESWLIANSSHVIDLAFYLAGKPTSMAAFSGGKNQLNWHPDASQFSGAGVTRDLAVFSYIADWSSAGRWAIEVMTDQNRYYLKPLESLQVQKRGVLAIEGVALDGSLDERFKPGIYRQTKSFLEGNDGELPSVQDQASMMKLYHLILHGGSYHSDTPF